MKEISKVSSVYTSTEHVHFDSVWQREGDQ